MARNPNEYATLDQIKAAYATHFLIRLTNFEGVDPGTAIIDAKLTEALTDASDKMDGFIQGRYAVPVNPAPEQFKPDCMCIAIMMLIKRKGYSEGTPDYNSVKDGEKCLKYYEMISKGQIDLSLPGVEGGGTTPPTKIRTETQDKVYTKTVLDKY